MSLKKSIVSIVLFVLVCMIYEAILIMGANFSPLLKAVIGLIQIPGLTWYQVLAILFPLSCIGWAVIHYFTLKLNYSSVDKNELLDYVLFALSISFVPCVTIEFFTIVWSTFLSLKSFDTVLLIVNALGYPVTIAIQYLLYLTGLKKFGMEKAVIMSVILSLFPTLVTVLFI